jgi:hypothetical protein
MKQKNNIELLTIIAISFILTSCYGLIKVKPDFIKDGKEYIIRERCIQSHEVDRFDYHYGFNIMTGKYEYHLGNHTETVCDEYVLDTFQIK